MYIIFGQSTADVPDNYTVLELDTFRLPPNGELFCAHAVIEKVPLQEFPLLEANKKLHADLIHHYRRRQWQYCEQALGKLLGQWAGELDTFYLDLGQRIASFKVTEPPEHWDAVIDKTSGKSQPVQA